MTGKHRPQIIAILSLAFVILSGFLSSTSAESRLALVIGNGAYSKEAALKTPPNDAQRMAKALRVLNFELFGGGVHVNATQTQMRQLIRGFAQELSRQSVGLFYYSGHGMQVDNRNYILPIDAEIEDRVDIRVQGVSVDEEVLWRMSQANPIISIVLLDACRNNPFEKRVKGRGASKGLGDTSAERGSIIGFASEPNSVAYESKGRYSYFTDALAREIVKPGVSITQVLRRVRVAVRDATNSEQIPTTRELLFDDFYPLPANIQSLPASPTSNVIFSDDFSLATLGNIWEPASGDWYVKDGVLNGLGDHYKKTSGKNWAAIILRKEIPRNASVSFRTRIIDGSTAELILHLSGNKYIRVYIYEISQDVVIGDGKFIDDHGSIGGGPSLDIHDFPVKKRVWYAITTNIVGNEYIVKVDGEKLIHYTDNMNHLNNEGTIGFLTNGHVQFDDLVVTSRAADGRAIQFSR